MTHRLAGAVEKFNRAKEQFDSLIGEMDAFFGREPKPYKSVGKFDPDSREWVERFRVVKEPPLRLGVIFGDCLHNLRCVLDHLMWEVTKLDGECPDGSTQFPVASKCEEQFESMADFRIPGLSDEHRAIVKRVQPYHAGDEADSHPLSILATLSNLDKHQIINATYSFMNVDAAEALDRLVGNAPEGRAPSGVVSFHMAKRGTRLVDDTPWFRIKFALDAEPPADVKMKGDLTLGVAFGEIGLDAGDFPMIAETVHGIVEVFLADFPETKYVEA